MPGEVVPFGKYKGQPVEIMAADTDYCEWLTAQPWFRSRYGNVYNILIAGGAEPQDTPEHNEMQARFLDDDWCLRLAALLIPDFADGSGEAAARRGLNASPMCREFRDCLEFRLKGASIRNRQFEDRGWDVFFHANPARITVHGPMLDRLPACICHCDHDECSAESPCQGGAKMNSFLCRHNLHAERRNGGGPDSKIGGGETDHCVSGCPWGKGGPLREPVPDGEDFLSPAPGYSCTTKARWLSRVATHGHCFGIDYLPYIHVELKPDLGDDYPAVLRQVQRYPCSDMSRRCVVVRRYAFESVTWDQVSKIFAASGITLLAESEIEAAGDPEKRGLALVKQELGAEVTAE